MRRAVSTNAKQKRFHNFLAERGCAVTRAPAHIHHCVGSSASHDRVPIGQWFVIPLAPELHQGKGGIHCDRSLLESFGFSGSRKDIEKQLFLKCAKEYIKQGGDIPEIVIEKIKEYRR